MTTAEQKLQKLITNPAEYSKEAHARARAASDRDLGRAMAKKQAGSRSSAKK